MNSSHKAYFHLPGLFEFYDFYEVFLDLFREHREYFYDWCEIGSIYGAPADCIWGGGRAGFGGDEAEDAAALLRKHHISARLTFSNSLLREEHLQDIRCHKLCDLFETGPETADAERTVPSGIIICSDLLLSFIRERWPGFYFVSSTTKVLTDFEQLRAELDREEFAYVVPDFRLNKAFEKMSTLTAAQKQKVEFLVNECCDVGCRDRKRCYENVSRKNLGEDCPDHICRAPGGAEGYRFSRAMKSRAFISPEDIRERYLPMGFSNFKIEGRGLGSAVLLEFLLYYLTKPEYQLIVREEIYLDSTLDLF